MTCSSSTQGTLSTFEEIVQTYISGRREDVKRELRYFSSPKSLDDVISLAALSQFRNGKRHPHQRRIPKDTLQMAKKNLIAHKSKLKSCRSFDNLHEVVRQTIGPIYRIGELAVYDISCRLGAYLGHSPDYIYLHAGTRKGAKALGLPTGRKKLKIKNLPHSFTILSPHEAEDCLCLYKSQLKRLGGST